MKKLAILALSLTLAACGTANHIASAPNGTVNTSLLTRLADDIHATQPPTTPLTAELSPIDALVQHVLSPTFVEHANKALAMAGTDDPIFSQCVNFGLTLREELIAQPLISKPAFSITAPDLTCPLCVLEAKRHALAAVESGVLSAQIGQLRARVRSIRTRKVMACGPLLMDETDVAGHAVALFGGLF